MDHPSGGCGRSSLSELAKTRRDTAPVGIIRDALPGDVAALAALKLATFRETFLDGFGIPYPPADLARFEAETYGAARIAAELADPAHATWVVEGQGGATDLVAYAHVGPCKLPHGYVRAGEMELYQIYLRGSAQGGGLGRRLFNHAIAALQGRGRVWLGVWSGNIKARDFYVRAGFREVGTYQFAVGDWLDDELIMRRDVPPVAR